MAAMSVHGKTFTNLLIQNGMVDMIETLYTESGTQVQRNLFK